MEGGTCHVTGLFANGVNIFLPSMIALDIELLVERDHGAHGTLARGALANMGHRFAGCIVCKAQMLGQCGQVDVFATNSVIFSVRSDILYLLLVYGTAANMSSVCESNYATPTHYFQEPLCRP